MLGDPRRRRSRPGRQRHLLQLAYVDSLIGDLVQELKAQGIYDDALVVLTADHGISFEPGGADPRDRGPVPHA